MWQVVLQLFRQNRKFIFALFLVAILEIGLSRIIAAIFPETWYLRSFLSWELMQRTRDFQNGRFRIIPDEKLGWRNQPNFGQENISSESRFPENIGEKEQSKLRVIFLGDSRISGASKKSEEQTVCSYLENENVETVNFGTDYFSLDQMYLLLMEAAKQYSPDVVVVALSSENTELLDCLYLPFCDPDVEFALVKPRFTLEKSHLILIQPNILEFLNDIPNSIEPLAFFHRYDSHYKKFEQFKKQEFTPFLGMFNLMKRKVEEWGNDANETVSLQKDVHLKNKKLANELLKSMQVYAHEWNFRLILLLLPNAGEFENPAERIAYEELEKLAKQDRLDFVAGLEVLQREAPGKKNFRDATHLTPAANRILASKLMEIVKPDFSKKSGS